MMTFRQKAFVRSRKFFRAATHKSLQVINCGQLKLGTKAFGKFVESSFMFS